MLTLSLAALVCCGPARALINPILPGWNPDPSILRVGNDYFLSTSTFEQFPGHPIYHSTDLVKWSIIGHALTRVSQIPLFGSGGPPDGGIWAPSLRYHRGTFYLATASRFVYGPEAKLMSRPFYVKTRDIFSNVWSDPVFIDSLGYDLDLFWDDNEDVYATWSGINNAVDRIYGIYQTKIDIATGDALTPTTEIYTGTLAQNASARPEGPHLYRIGAHYYLLIAEGGTGAPHRATVARGPSPSGPWTPSPHNPLVYNVGLDPDARVRWTGHADLVQTPRGEWFGTMLGTRPQGGNESRIALGRETFLYPVAWTADGWPIANGGKPVTEHLPGVLYDRSPLAPYVNDFATPGDLADPSFYFVRTQYKPFASVAKDGGLVLKGNAYNLSDRDAPALLLRRQSAYSETFETRLDGFAPATNWTEAGLSVWYGEFLHHDIGVTLDPAGSGRRVVVTRTLTYPTVTTYTPLSSASGNVRLRAVANATHYALGFAEGADAAFTTTAIVDTYYVTVPPPNGAFFKGTSFGLYNTGNGRATLVKARFAYWKQTPVVPPLDAAT